METKGLTLKNQKFQLLFDEKRGGFISMKSPIDDFKADFLLTPAEFPKFDVQQAQWLANFNGKVKKNNETLAFFTGGRENQVTMNADETQLSVDYPTDLSDTGLQLNATSKFTLSDEDLTWDLTLKNNSSESLEITELALPFLMDQYFRGDDDFKYEQCVLRHSCVTGNSSYFYWEKSSGNPPLLLVTETSGNCFVEIAIATEEPFEYQQYPDKGYEGMPFLYLVKETSLVNGVNTAPVVLAPGETVSYKILLSLLEKETAINEKLAAVGQNVLKAVPGMVGPKDDSFFIMTQPVEAEVTTTTPEDEILSTSIKNGWKVTEVRFGAYGRRTIQVTHGNQQDHYVFFATEAVADMIQNHAAFIAENHFETDPEDPCYHALLMWDMVNKRRINSTFNPYFEDWWSGGSDEPGLVSGLYLSEKNVHLPNEKEINVLSAYVEDFLIERLTEQPGWRVHRMVPWYTMFEPWAGRGADDVWRAFNYVHVINVMRNMYLIQKRNDYPQLRTATEYLLMAYEYTKAMFNYWMYPHGVGASEFGNMGEMSLPLYLQQELTAEGYLQEAAEMGAIFDKKAHFFDSKDFPFGSEMIYDSTAFEAVYGYGNRIDSEHIKGAAARASFANRGKQPVWYLYNTDVRGGGDSHWNTSYMTQLGAFPLWDRSLNEGRYDEEWLMSYYGAFLSGWLIYNSGGYWDDAPANEGATGWISVSNEINTTGQPKPKGFPYSKGLVILSGEAELGFFGALRTASSFVMDHSVLGEIGMGCHYTKDGASFTVVPNDGLSTRFYHLPLGVKIEITGGQLEEIRYDGKELLIACSTVGNGSAEVVISSIPEAGAKSQVLSTQQVLSNTYKSELTFSLNK